MQKLLSHATIAYSTYYVKLSRPSVSRMPVNCCSQAFFCPGNMLAASHRIYYITEPGRKSCAAVFQRFSRATARDRPSTTTRDGRAPFRGRDAGYDLSWPSSLSFDERGRKNSLIGVPLKLKASRRRFSKKRS